MKLQIPTSKFQKSFKRQAAAFGSAGSQVLVRWFKPRRGGLFIDRDTLPTFFLFFGGAHNAVPSGQATPNWDSLSPRERAGVRGNSAHDQKRLWLCAAL